jgi:CBS domain-containing protein
MGILCPTCGGNTERISVLEGGVRKPLYVCRNCTIAWKQEEGTLGIHLLQTYAMAKDLDDDAFYELLKRISDYESGGAPKLCDIMTQEVAVVSGKESLLEAARLMAEKGISCLVVVDREGKPEGIITSHDIAEKLSVSKHELDKIKVEEVMSWPVIAAEDYTNIIKASKIMRKRRIKNLPVTRKGKIVGIVTVNDFAKVPPEYMEEIASNLAELGDAFL